MAFSVVTFPPLPAVDYITGKYIFDDGYNFYYSTDDRKEVTVDGVLYDITRNAETNAITISERSPAPGSIDFYSEFNRKAVTLNDGRIGV